MIEAKLIGQIIQTYRENRGISQEVLSGLAGLDRTHYSKIERGLRTPTLDTLFKIAHALDISPHEIVAMWKWGTRRLKFFTLFCVLIKSIIRQRNLCEFTLNRFDFRKICRDSTEFNVFIVDSNKIRFDTCKI